MQPQDVYNRAFDTTTASLDKWIDTIRDVGRECRAGIFRRLLQNVVVRRVGLAAGEFATTKFAPFFDERPINLLLPLEVGAICQIVAVSDELSGGETGGHLGCNCNRTRRRIDSGGADQQRQRQRGKARNAFATSRADHPIRSRRHSHSSIRPRR